MKALVSVGQQNESFAVGNGGGLRFGCLSACLNFSGLIDINDHSKPNPNMKEAQPHWISKIFFNKMSYIKL